MAVQTSDAASIALLRGFRAGERISFIHRADVCSAVPADLVADLLPVPGTEGYSSIWYFYCPKKYKNARGKASGHRQRAIGGGDTCWRPEVSAKDVVGPNSGTFCNLSYGRKNGGSGRSFDRLGWCMVEYDDQLTSNNGGGDHVLCKVYQSSSSLAKGKAKEQSAPASKAKRKAAAEDHPEAPPTKTVHHHEEEQVQVQQHATFNSDQAMPYFHGQSDRVSKVNDPEFFVQLAQQGATFKNDCSSMSYNDRRLQQQHSPMMPCYEHEPLDVSLLHPVQQEPTFIDSDPTLCYQQPQYQNCLDLVYHMQQSYGGGQPHHVGMARFQHMFQELQTSIAKAAADPHEHELQDVGLPHLVQQTPPLADFFFDEETQQQLDDAVDSALFLQEVLQELQALIGEDDPHCSDEPC